MKYNSFVNPFISCKTDIVISLKCYNVMYIHYNAGAGYKAWQQKPKWTCNFAWKSFFLGSILNSNFFVNPFSSDAYRPTIHYNAGRNYMHTL